MTKNSLDLSLIIPVLNEEENITRLYSKLRTTLTGLKILHEIIFIDDGSTDNSFKILEEIQKKDKCVKIIKFRRNFGKSAALSAGFKEAKGDTVITMDGDLQDDPTEIPRFLEAIKKTDLVVGWRFNRKDPISKRLPSKIFNKLTSILTGVKIHDSNCCFKAYRSEVIKNINIYGELHRYIPALAYWKGFGISEIKVNHNPRIYGKSKYGFMRIFKGFMDLITIKFLTKYIKKPFHLFGGLGFLSTFLGFVIGLRLLYVKYFLNIIIGDRPLLYLSMLLIMLGIQFISLGLLGEMISNTKKTEQYNIEIIYEHN